MMFTCVKCGMEIVNATIVDGRPCCSWCKPKNEAFLLPDPPAVHLLPPWNEILTELRAIRNGIDVLVERGNDE